MHCSALANKSPMLKSTITLMESKNLRTCREATRNGETEGEGRGARGEVWGARGEVRGARGEVRGARGEVQGARSKERISRQKCTLPQQLW